MTVDSLDGPLAELASLFGVEDGYEGVDGAWHPADADAVTHVLGALGAELDGSEGVDDALGAARAQLARRIVEPVVALHHGTAVVASTLPAGSDLGEWRAVLTAEDGSTHRLRSTAPPPRRRADGRVDVGWDLAPAHLEAGYHRLELSDGKTVTRCLVLVAPRCPSPARGWGLFEPVHALRGDADAGIGTYRDLATLAEWAGGLGAAFVGTLPLYPTFASGAPRTGATDPSPYLPVTRLGWSELYLGSGPPLSGATAGGPSSSVGGADDSVDYPAVADAVRYHLAPRAERALHPESPDRGPLLQFAAEHPELVAYARFRELVAEGGRPPSRTEAGVDPDSLGPTGRFHLYVQWQADRELARLAGRLYLDLPVGVHPDGFDPWWFPDSFADGVVGGAPPDAFYAEGQTWGFRPMHPVRLREDGYRYPIACMHQVMRRASLVRIDHVMGLHRLFWVPEGADARHGVYVRNHLDEMRAVVAIEAERAGTAVVGEDLGTVPDEVRRAMADSGILRSWVMEFEVSADDPLPAAPADSLASVATHDLPRFAAYWDGEDIDEQAERGILDEQEVKERRSERAGWRASLAAPVHSEEAGDPPGGDLDPRDGLATCLERMAAGPALQLLVDLEDLWLERRPVNQPGRPEAPNWRVRSRRTVAQAMEDEDVQLLLTTIDRRRREGGGTGAPRGAVEGPGRSPGDDTGAPVPLTAEEEGTR